MSSPIEEGRGQPVEPRHRPEPARGEGIAEQHGDGEVGQGDHGAGRSAGSAGGGLAGGEPRRGAFDVLAELRLEERDERRRTVATARPVDADRRDVAERLERIADHPHGARRVALELDRDPLEVEPVLEEEVDQLDVDGEALDRREPEDLGSDVTAEHLEAALGVVDATGHERPEREAGQLRDDRAQQARALVGGAGQRPVADHRVVAALLDVRDRQRQRFHAIGKIAVGERADVPGRRGHARPDGGALPAVLEAQHADAVVAADRVGRAVGAPVVGHDDLAVDPGTVEELQDASHVGIDVARAVVRGHDQRDRGRRHRGRRRPSHGRLARAVPRRRGRARRVGSGG